MMDGMTRPCGRATTAEEDEGRKTESPPPSPQPTLTNNALMIRYSFSLLHRLFSMIPFYFLINAFIQPRKPPPPAFSSSFLLFGVSVDFGTGHFHR